MKEIKEDTKNRKRFHIHGLEELSLLLKAIYKFDAVYSMAFFLLFLQKQKNNPKIVRNHNSKDRE